MTNPATQTPQRLRAAFVRRVHGVGGEVRVEPMGGDWRRFRRGLRLRSERDDRELRVRSARDGGEGTALLGFQGVDTPEAARDLSGTYLTVDTGAARRLGDDEWFVWQLLGLDVVSEEGAKLGVVDDIESGVANDVLVVRDDRGVRRLPMVRAVVQKVDVQAGSISVTQLLEDEA